MSLQVWLPLTGNLHNQGLSDATIINGDITANDNGKIGKCVKTGNSAIDLRYDGATTNTESLSIGGWFKFNQSEIATRLQSATINEIGHSPVGNLIGNNSYGGIGLIWETNNMYQDGTLNELHVFGNMRSSTLGYRSTGTYTISFDQWTHIFLIFDKSSNTESLYVNGVRVSQITSLASFSDASTRNIQINAALVCGGNGPGVNIPFYCNDVRIYNHALTESEVKEISRGLVLHYPLNDRYVEPTANIITSLRAGGRTVVVDGDKIQNTGENVDTYFYLVTPKLVAGKTYTLSYYCQGLSDSDLTWQFGVGAQSATHANHCGYIPIRNGRSELTFICPESLDGNTLLILDDYAATWRTSIITISQIQLESGSTRTPYTPFNTVSDGTTNLLTGNAKKISTWTNYMPSYVTLSEDSEGCKYTLLQGVGGWEKIFTDAIPVETGKSYTLSFDYTVEQNYNGYSGSFGLSVCTTSQAAYGNDTNVLAQLQFGTSQLSRRRGYITFTATTDEVYLVANGGRIADGQENISFVIDKLILAESIMSDISGYQHNGVINNALGTSADMPRYRSCIDIVDGSYIDTSLTENIGVGDFSVSVWIKMPQTSGKTYQPIFSNKTTVAASNGFAIYFNQNQNKLLWSTADGTNATEIWTANTVDLYDKWVHIVMVRNSTDARKGYFYINGERWELASIPPIRDISNDEYTIKLGDIATHTNSAYRYVGLMSDFRLYTTALSADDIAALYEMGVSA